MIYITLPNHLETLVMKYLYKSHTLPTISIFVALILCFTISNHSSAESVPNREQVRSAICTRVDGLSDKINQNILHKQQNLEILHKDKSKKIQSSFEENTKQITSSRVQWDKNREIHYKKLNEKVQNQNQKNAIEQFKTTIEDAVLKRRSAFDMATQDYRSSIELTLNNKQNGVEAIVDNYKLELTKAKDQANLDCKNNKDESEIRSNFNSSLQASRTTLVSDRSGMDQILLQINTAKQIRADAIQKATQEFQSTLNSAKEILKSSIEQ